MNLSDELNYVMGSGTFHELGRQFGEGMQSVLKDKIDDTELKQAKQLVESLEKDNEYYSRVVTSLLEQVVGLKERVGEPITLQSLQDMIKEGKN